MKDQAASERRWIDEAGSDSERAIREHLVELAHAGRQVISETHLLGRNGEHMKVMLTVEVVKK